MAIALDFGAVLADWPLLLRGLGMTAALTAVAALAGVALGVACAWARVHGGTALKAVVACYVELIRNTPFIVQLFFIFFGLPSLGLKRSDELTAVAAGDGDQPWCVQHCEIIRAGIQNCAARPDRSRPVSLAMSPAAGVPATSCWHRRCSKIWPALTSSQLVIVMFGSAVCSGRSPPQELTLLAANFIQSPQLPGV